ncbi:CRE-MLK-1 protein [Caenorhabditis remanei]|uniref:CRE-MLK-1 protein n=1 Tax=Caenorhabditis remanei TaxID=31234 RepID=E3LP05_CAERE|nr:CRE-MLK-1 protein [Caenorhabditis remanei]
MEPSYPSYVNIAPKAKTRSMSHLAPTPEHNRSVSYEETTTASTSTDSVPSVRIRSESSQISMDSPVPASEKCVAAYEYEAQREDELALPIGSILRVIKYETQEDGWYLGSLDGKVGMFPANYVRLLPAEESLVGFHADDISLPEENKTLEDFRIGHGATATVFKVDLKINKSLDKGAMGDVSSYQMKAALKRFNKHTYNSRGEHMTDAEQLEMLKREANLVDGLSHNNIVRLLGICLEDPYFGLLLELCEGSSLRTVCRSMNSDSSIPLGVLVDWAKQVAQGMEYLTKEGYVHRDLKADNVLVKEEVCLCMDEITMKYEWCTKCGRRPLDKLQLKITDFGVTRKMTADANRFSTAGTYAWLAPEAFRDGAWSESSDVWSYGVVLWELLSREDPYQGQIPATIAFQIVMRGQSLIIDENCPTQWKNIMQKCWNLDPTKRPKFSALAVEFKEYAKELEAVTQLQRAPSKMAVKEIYTECNNSKGKEELEKMFNDLYVSTNISDIHRADRRSIAPETKARKLKHLPKGKKLEITGPMGDVVHLVSVQLDKSNEKKFKINYNDENYNGGTLPRLNDRQSSLSLSSPDLHHIQDIISGSNTVGRNRISRKNAIRLKKAHPNMYDSHLSSPTNDDSNTFAKIDNADEIDPSHTKEKKVGTFSRAWAKLPWKTAKRDSKEEHDERATAGSISSRSSSTTSSNRIITGQTTRGAAALPFLEAGTRSRAQSAADCWDDSNSNKKCKASPNGKGPVKQTNLTERFVKDNEKDSEIRPGHLPTYHRKSALDQTIPPSPNSPDSLINFPPMHVSSRRTTANSSSDGATCYEQLVTNPSGAGHGLRNPIIHPSLSDIIPTYSEEQTHYDMGPGRYLERNGHSNQGLYGHINYSGAGHGRPNQSTHYYPVGGGCDSYIPISPKVVMKPTVGEVNNSPYSDNFRMMTRNVQNPQYIQCKQDKKPPMRTPALPIKIQSESNLVNTGMLYSSRPENLNGIENSLSSLSLNEAPDIPAPPPPRISMSPPTRLAPVLPPRDGSLSPDPRRIMDKEILKTAEVGGTEIF